MASKTLAGKLAEVMGEIGYISKGGTNSAQGYKYVMASQVADAIREKLAAKGIAIIPGDIEKLSESTSASGKQVILTFKYSWHLVDGETGEKHTIYSLGSGADSGDKHVYKATTGALKYALLTTFLIPTGDDPENDTADVTIAKAAKEIFKDTVKPMEGQSQKADGEWGF
ncbi:MAG: hypothetical protein EBR82_12980 [Caulobacteraceae bacterium]|jgi:hypothetical protein|nr:hypothetical protein [Caulobacteraceae bacterium]